MPALCCLPTRTFPSYEEKKKRNSWAVSASFILVSVISECNSQQYAAYRKDQLLRGTKHHWFKTKLSFYHDFIFLMGKLRWRLTAMKSGDQGHVSLCDHPAITMADWQRGCALWEPRQGPSIETSKGTAGPECTWAGFLSLDESLWEKQVEKEKHSEVPMSGVFYDKW